MQFDNIDSALMALKNGETIIVVDDENRENEGDLVAVTEWMNDNTINFMAKEARGLIAHQCLKILHNVWIWYKWLMITPTSLVRNLQ